MKFSNLFFLICLFIFVGCSFYKSFEIENNTYVLINKHTNRYKNFGFSIEGIGVSIPEYVKWICIDYKINREASIDQSRSIVIEMIDYFLLLVSKDNKFMKYVDGIFDYKNIDICIHFSNIENSYQQPPSIAYVMAVSDKIIYYQYDQKEERLLEIYKETFENAIKVE